MHASFCSQSGDPSENVDQEMFGHDGTTGTSLTLAVETMNILAGSGIRIGESSVFDRMLYRPD